MNDPLLAKDRPQIMYDLLRQRAELNFKLRMVRDLHALGLPEHLIRQVIDSIERGGK